MTNQKTPLLQRASTPVVITILFGIIISSLDFITKKVVIHNTVGQLSNQAFKPHGLLETSGIPNGAYLSVISISLFGTLILFLMCYLLRKKGLTQDELPRKIAAGSLVRSISIAIMLYWDWFFIIRPSSYGSDEMSGAMAAFAYMDQFGDTLRWFYYLTPFWILCFTIVYVIKHRKEFNKLGFVEREKAKIE